MIAKLTAQSYRKCIAILLFLFILGNVIQYHFTTLDKYWYNTSNDKHWYRSTFTYRDAHEFYVRGYKFNISEGVLETLGYYSTNGSTHHASIKLRGLDILLNDIKPKILNDPKLEKALLPYEKFFIIQDRTVEDVNCRLIINGNITETKLASNKSVSQPRQNPLLPIDYINKTSDCKVFVAERGYIMKSLTSVEAAFAIAFSILMYKDIEQVERLLRAIYRPQNIYCIHVDKKTDNDTYNAMEGIAKCFGNVFMAPRRIAVRWGMFSVLEPELMCMEALLQRNKKWKYFINLTGQEFPLRTNYELVKILMAYNGANDIEGTFKRANKKRWDFLPPPPHNLTAFKGAVHIAANRDFVDFALHNKKAKDLLQWVKKVKVPDECFFATLNHNPILRIKGSYLGYPETDNTNIKPFLARFKNRGLYVFNWKCHGKRVRQMCHLGAGDLPLLSTRRELFANKFDWNYERYARDCLEELHFNRTRDEYLGKASFDTRYYQELGFVKNKVE